MSRYQESFDSMATDASNHHQRGYEAKLHTHLSFTIFELGYRSYEQELGQSIASLCLNRIFPHLNFNTFAKESITQKATWTLYLHIRCRQHMPAKLIPYSAAIARSKALAAFL